jgi:hypothetical protein
MAEALDTLIAALAAKQHGYITRTQLLAIGLGAAAIDYRVESGRLIPAYRGVYALGYPNRTPVARACAAVLACGRRALLSHGSAAALWGFYTYWDEPFEVTVPSLRTRAGIRVHRSTTLIRRDLDRQLGVRVTSPARTVLDVAPRLTNNRLTRVVNDARHARLLHLDDLADVLKRNPFHPGTRWLRTFVENPRNPTRSPLEDDFMAFVKRYGLPVPVTNTYLLGYEIDVLYPAERVIVEVDSYGYHSDRGSFRRDRKRDVVMLAAGYVTVRITDDRMEHDGAQEADRLQAILDERP